MGVKAREKPKGSGIWYIFIEHHGKRRAKKIGRDKRLAIQMAKKIEAKLTLKDTGLLDEEDNQEQVFFCEVAIMWLNDYVKTMRRSSTHERYKGILDNHILPSLGKLPISQIRKGDIRTLLLSKKRDYATSTVCMIRDVTSGVFNYALDDEIISTNPVTGITKRLGLERDKKEVRPMTLEEVSDFLETCQKYQPEHYPLFLTAFRTGMRMGELLGLKWRDIDFHNKAIDIKRTFKNGQINKPKNGKSRRADMSKQLLHTLKILRTKRNKEALAGGTGKIVDVIFHRKGEHMAQNSLRYIFKRLLRKAELRDMRFHDIRHTYASHLLSNGHSPVYVREQMGHHSISVTVDIYGHFMPSGNRDAVNSLDTSTQPSATQAQPPKTKGL